MYIEEQVRKLYKEGKSPYEIAEILGTYPNKIRRMLIKIGEPIRDKKEAQSNAIKQNRTKHPTKGKERSESVRRKISKSMYENWKDLPLEERKKRSITSKENWNK